MSLITLAEAKTYLRKGGTVEDTLIQTLLDAAEQTVSSLTNVVYKTSTGTAVTEKVFSDGQPILWLSHRPVLSVTSVTDMNGNVTASTDYIVGTSGVTLEVGTWYTPRSLSVPSKFYYTVVYTGGYSAATLPAAHKLAVFRLLGRLYEDRSGAGSYSSENTSTSYLPWDEFVNSVVSSITTYTGSNG